MAKPDEKLTKTAILKRIYGVLILEYIHRPMGVKISVSDLAKIQHGQNLYSASVEPIFLPRRAPPISFGVGLRLPRPLWRCATRSIKDSRGSP